MDQFRARLEQALAGQYRFIRELGGGGMSRTYLADEPALQRRIVVKVLAPEMLEGLSVERFKREVLMAASLQHPHVVPVLAAGDADGLPWFSMPYVDGDSLRQRLESGRLTIAESVGVLRDVARALSYAHAQGIVHRDIKPDNVLLSAGSATVTDFGIAKAITASRTSAAGATLTQVGLAIGTPAYMAPEQAEGTVTVDHRADIYAFGAMAYELFTGQPPFVAGTPGRMLVAHLTETPRDPRTMRPDLPAPLAELVLACLAKSPDERPNEVAILRALDGAGSTASSAPSLTMAPVALPMSAALGTWAGGSTLLVGGVLIASKAVGVPGWALPSAITLSLAGLPALLGAWWIQRTAQRTLLRTPTLTPGGTLAPQGTLATLALRAHPHVSYRRTRKAGLAIGAGFAALLTAFAVSRAYGIGPAASLIGAGEFKTRESVLVADFHPPANDSTLGATVAEALRTDLAQSPNLAVVTRATVRELLQRMQRPADALVPFDLAREIATREGTKAVVDGDVVRLGTSYVLSARLVSATDGRELAAFRETAENDAELVPAVGALSRQIREKVGESLKGLRNAKALERVSTPSLAALRKYVEGTRLEESGGDRTRALKLLQEAVAIDSAFAMAWRKIAVLYSLTPNARTQLIAASAKAYALRDRLSDTERDLTDAFYFSYGPSPDPEKALAAYEQLLARDSVNSTALNNIGVAYNRQRDYRKAFAIYDRAARLDRPPAVTILNLSFTAATLRNPVAADSAVAIMQRLYPGNRVNYEVVGWQLWSRNQNDSLTRMAMSWLDTAQSARQVTFAANFLGGFAARRGQISQSLSIAERGADRTSALTESVAPRMGLAGTRAQALALYDGDRAATHAVLQRMLTAPDFASVPPADRPWRAASVAAALVGDGESAKALSAAFQRDLAERSIDRAWETARYEAQEALATGAYGKAVSLFRQAGSLRAAPNLEETFLLATSFDRAQQADSAIAWFRKAVDTTRAREPAEFTYAPAAHKRLAELLDAKGDAAGAIEHYDAFATLWKDAEPARQPVVKAARDRAAQLRAKKDPG